MIMINILSGRFEIGSPGVAVMIQALKTELIDSPEVFKQALKKSITEYLKTSEGKTAKEYAGDDFNIGDLYGELENKELVSIFQKNGIEKFEIITFDEVWNYDMRLV